MRYSHQLKYAMKGWFSLSLSTLFRMRMLRFYFRLIDEDSHIRVVYYYK